MPNITKWIVRVLRWLPSLVFVVLISVFLILQIPQIQQRLVTYIVSRVESQSGHHISIGKVDIDWFDQFSLDSVNVKDFNGNIMLSLDHLEVDFDLLELYDESTIVFNQLNLKGGEVNIVKYNDSTALNLNVFLSELNKSGGQATIIRLEEIKCDGISIAFDDRRIGHVSTGLFDLRHWSFLTEEFGISNVAIHPGVIDFSVSQLSALEEFSGFKVDRFDGSVSIDANHVVIDDLFVKTPDSQIGDSLSISYKTLDHLKYFTDSVRLDLMLRNTIISPRDIAFFSSLKLDNHIGVDGYLEGTIKGFRVKEAEIKYGDSFLTGDFSFIGLPDVNATFMDLDIQKGSLTPFDLSQFVDLPFDLTPLKLSGNLTGFASDFVAAFDLEDAHGKISTDVNLKLIEGKNKALYSGRLSLDDYDLGSSMENELFGKVNFQGRINGTGLTQQSADFLLAAAFSQTEFGGNLYDNFNVNGRFRSEFFSGDVVLQDNSIVADGTGTIDFRGEVEIIDIEIELTSINLQHYGITQDSLIASGNLVMKLEEIDPERASGSVFLRQIQILGNDFSSKFGGITLTSDANENYKQYKIEGDGFEGELKGDFSPSGLINIVGLMAREYVDNLAGEHSFSLSKYQEYDQFKADFEFRADDLDKYFDVLQSKIQLDGAVRVSGSIAKRNDLFAVAFVDLDSFLIGNRLLVGNSMDFNISKDLSDEYSMLSVVYLESETQDWDVVPDTEQLRSELIWEDNQVKIQLELDQPSNSSSVNLKSQLELLEDEVLIKLMPSRVKLLDQDWEIDTDHLITLVENKLNLDSLVFYSSNQQVMIHGVVSDTLQSDLKIDFKEFDIENISTILPRKFEGTMNGDMTLSRENLASSFDFGMITEIADLRFEDVLMGDLSGIVEWNNIDSSIYVGFDVSRQSIETIELKGKVFPFEDSQQLDLSLEFRQMNLKLFEPFVNTTFSQIEGFSDGKVAVSGRMGQPQIKGSATVEKGKGKFDYLNTSYAFDGNVGFDRSKVYFESVNILDRMGNIAYLNGSLDHSAFPSINTNVMLDFEDFEVMNTTRFDNSVYYGTLYATGRMTMTGPVNNLRIVASGETSPNSKLYIPFVEESSVQQQDFIHFGKLGVDQSETESVSPKAIQVSGITLEMDVDVTRDAYVEMIFDPVTGDIIRGRGEGNLQFKLNSNGDFDLFGSIEVKEGAYNWTTSLMMNKEFKIVPGGTINYYGNPYEGILDLDATYRQLAAPADWFGDDARLSNRSPVLVVLGLEGDMSKPDIKFDIQLDEVSGVNVSSDDWRELLSAVNNDKEELKRQVFSLLLFRKFSPRNSFVVGSFGDQGLLEGSVSEFMSNQLSYWINQVDENLEVSFDLNGLDQDAFNAFQLRLAYTFMDGRLRVSSGGMLNNTTQQSTVSGFFGDWSVDYSLTEDGRLRAKIFSQSGQNDLARGSQRLSDFQGNETGASFQYVRSFDEFSELLKKSREKAKRTSSTSTSSTESGN
ncbi:MAG: translocation/assembly module TamB domain-containing protein [Cyclobacteriaceae bacterium]